MTTSRAMLQNRHAVVFSILPPHRHLLGHSRGGGWLIENMFLMMEACVAGEKLHDGKPYDVNLLWQT